MAVIRKKINVLKRAPIVLRWLNRSVMTKPMFHDQNLFIGCQTKLFARDKTLYPWPNRLPMTKYDQSFPQWSNHSIVSQLPIRLLVTKPIIGDQTVCTRLNPTPVANTIHPWPNSSRDHTVHPCSKLPLVVKASNLTKPFTHDQTINLWPNRSPIIDCSPVTTTVHAWSNHTTVSKPFTGN